MVTEGTIKKEVVNPKAIIHKRFGNKAIYNIEEIQEFASNGCPGLALPQKGPCLYRCSLELPEFTVVSDIFKRKKDATQSAAEKALEKLSDPPVEDPSDQLVSRLTYLFSDDFYSICHPLSGHFRAALQREGHLNGFVPVFMMPVFDSKISNLCKAIKPEIESKPLEIMSMIMDAAARLSDTVVVSKEHFSLRRTSSYPPEVLQSVEIACDPKIYVKAIRVPYMVEGNIETLTLDVSSNKYYMDAIAQELGAADASRIMLSRCVGKASSETRFYFKAPKADLENGVYLNARASYLSGQDIYGDAILATIGYLWKSCDLLHEDVTLRTYYRLLMNKLPTGIYKLSREAILAAELPARFGTRSNWRGLYPRDILCAFARQHRLPEPVFSLIASNDISGPEENIRCEVKIFSKDQNLILFCYPSDSFKKQSEAIQYTSLKALSWLNDYLKKISMHQEELTLTNGNGIDIDVYPEHISKEFRFFSLVHRSWSGFEANGNKLLAVNDDVCSYNVEGPESDVFPTSGCLVCVCYSVTLVNGAENELLESNEEFEFELGSEAVNPNIEAVLSQMGVGQSVKFRVELPSQELIFAANGDPARTLSLLSSGECCLEFSVTLVRVTEPLEDRMEKALFSPSLSKQRVKYAVDHIKQSSATFLVDFGCGSGSLLDSLLDYSTSLERIVGVDISTKALARAAKTLHTKLSANSTNPVPCSGIKSALLLDGSITTFDSRLYGCDIGTCLEVIEHMSEDQATIFGNIVLSFFLPKILIISTPNYEYNTILRKSTPQTQEEEDSEDKNPTKPCKFRNFDHKFEWTREQFRMWASELSEKHNYSVEFSGVGGIEGVEPGFASQIAVFRRVCELPNCTDLAAVPYNVVWDWIRTNV
ncbi:small RNA 2'-O-methyltransferase [Rutidosis leptorrhynchoides]|uniref:small RNA 2'-O-methyltransferase n=1 Tax=Rutidosis leptorrhynchoides TaxID=125765 RepID=UPI003A9A0990